MCVRVCVSKSGGLSISAWGSVGWRCDGGDAKAQFESFLDSVVFITSAQLSGIDSINSRNDLMSQTCRQHAGIRSQLALLQTYSAAEKLKQVLLPRSPSSPLIAALSKAEKGASTAGTWQLICKPYGSC